MDDTIFIGGFLLVMVLAGLVMFGPILAALVTAWFVRMRAVRIACMTVAVYWIGALIYEWPPFYNCRCEPEPCAWCGGGAPG